MTDILILIGVGVTAGVINTLAGGGSLITLPVLIFLGLPGVEANATNRVAIMSQNIFAVAGFKSKKVDLPSPYIYYLTISSFLGGIAGTFIALWFPDHSFNQMLSIIMILVAISIIKKPKHIHVDEIVTDKRSIILGTVGFFFLGIYGGFLQAGIGFLTIVLLNRLNGLSLVKSNYIKVFVALVYTGIAMLIFAYMGKIHWVTGLTMAIGQGAGAWWASRWSVAKGDKWLRPIIVVAVIVLAVKLWFF
ncbi:MAG: sulfite exporter TauE/SafE family protein [Cyclobacteriaceae bacterium]